MTTYIEKAKNEAGEIEYAIHGLTLQDLLLFRRSFKVVALSYNEVFKERLETAPAEELQEIIFRINRLEEHLQRLNNMINNQTGIPVGILK